MVDSLSNLLRSGEYGPAYNTLMDSHWNLEDYDLPLARIAFKIFITASDVRSAQTMHEILYKAAYEEMEGRDIAALASLCAQSGDFQYGIAILHARLNYMLQERNIVSAEIGKDLFERLARIDNTNEGLTELLDGLGDLLCLTGDSVNAVRSYQTLITHRGSDPKLANLILGLLLCERNLVEIPLLEACNEAQAQHPRTKEIKMFTARSIWKLKGPEATVEWINEQSTSPTGSDFLWPWIAHAMLKRGDPAGAKQFIQDNMEKDKEAGRKIEIMSLFELARCYELLGQRERALEIIEYVTKDPRPLTFDIRQLVFDLAFNDLKDSQLALRVLKKTTTNDIYEIKRMKHEANIFAREKDHNKCLDAIVEFSQYMELTAAEHTMKGNALAGLRRYEEAIVEYRLAQSKGSAYESYANEIAPLLHSRKWDEALYSFCRLETKYEHETDIALVPMAYFLSGQWDKIGDVPTPSQYIDTERASDLYAQAVRIGSSLKCKPDVVEDELMNQCRNLGIEKHAPSVEQLFYRL